ncbi:MAG: hypothetical protein RLZZ543_1564 [Bacteroidota bacterium]
MSNHDLPNESRIQKGFSALFEPVALDSLIAFRVAFGLAMALWTLYMLFSGNVYEYFIEPRYFFNYPGLEWLKPIGAVGMYGVFLLLFLSALMIGAGWFFRISTVVFTIAFAYVSLIDKSNYLSYYYYVLLLGAMLSLSPAQRFFSIDLIRKPSLRVDFIPRWVILAFQLQVAMVFLFAGMAKLNADWLIHGRPMNIWLENLSLNSGLDFPTWVSNGWFPVMLSWLLILFDFVIPHFLLDRTTSMGAFRLVLVVQLLALILFPAGFFPLLTILSCTIFLPADRIRRMISGISYLLYDLFSFKGEVFQPGGSYMLQYRKKKLFPLLLLVFLSAQIFLPVSLFLQWGSGRWADAAFHFSWDIRLHEKEANVQVWRINPENGLQEELALGAYLTPHQQRRMAESPAMIHQFIHHLHGIEPTASTRFQLKALATISLNGGLPQQLTEQTEDDQTAEN